VSSKVVITIVFLLFLVTLAYTGLGSDRLGEDKIIDESRMLGYNVDVVGGGGGGLSVVDVSVRWVYDTIKQGENNWHAKEVRGFITNLNVDLNWGNHGNSLRLRIYTPEGYVLGPYFDSADGVMDGRIDLNIKRQNGIARGVWYYEVYGYNVTGVEDYYMSTTPP